MCPTSLYCNLPLVVNTGLAFRTGDFVQLYCDNCNYIIGQVVSYNSGTGAMVITPYTFEGTGTCCNWTVSLTGAPGMNGTSGISGGTGTAGTSGVINGTLNYVAKFTPDGNSVGDSIIYNAVSSVGVGTNTPAYKLDVNGTFGASGAAVIGGNLSVGTTYAGFAANIAGVLYVIGGEIFLTDGYAIRNASNNASIAFNTSTLNFTGAGVFNSSVGVGGSSAAYSLLESSSTTFGSTVSLMSLAIKDGTYNPRTTISYKTQTGSAYTVIFDSTYTSGWAATNYAFASGNLLVGTITDDTVNKLQVNGSGKFSGNVSIGYNNSFILGESPYRYKIYRSSAGTLETYFDDEYDVSDTGLNFRFRTLGTPITALRLASTGAATFSSSVTIGDKLIINGANTGSNQYNELNRNAITTESMFLWKTNGVAKWYIGQRSFNSEDGFSLFSTSAATNVLYFNPAGAATFSSSVTATELFLSTSNSNVGNINSTNANGGYLTWQTSGTTIADIGTAQQIFGSGGNDTFGINARGARSLVFGTNNTSRFSIASTGAATFSSSVTANSLLIKNSGVPAAQFFRDLDVTVVGPAGQGIEFGAKSGSTYIAGAAIYGTLFNPATDGNLIFQTLSGSVLGTRLTIASTGAATFSGGVTSPQFTSTSQVAMLLNNSGANNDFRLGSASSVFRVVNAANTVALLSITDTGAATFSSSVTAVNEYRLKSSAYPTTYNTILRSDGSANGVLQLGNNNINYILAGNTAAGGFLAIRVNVSDETLTSGTEAMRITSGGNTILGYTGSDSGEKLQVNGSIKSTATTTASSPSFATTVGGMFTDGTNLGFSVGTSRKAYLTSTGSFCVGSVLDGTTYLCNIGGNGYYNGGVYIQGTAAPNSAILLIGSGGTAASQIRLNTSTAPTSPTNGDIWFDGGSLKIQIGGVTKTVTVS